MSCRTDSDCGEGKFCWSTMGGGKECQVKTSYEPLSIPKFTQKQISTGISCKTDTDCKKAEFCWSVMGKVEKECQARLPSNQADEQTEKNTDQKEIVTNVIVEKKDGIVYLPNDNKPFTGRYEFFDSKNEKQAVIYVNGLFKDKDGKVSDVRYKKDVEIERRNNVAFLPNTIKPYEGSITAICVDGDKIESVYKNGIDVGTVMWEKGKKLYDEYNHHANSKGRGHYIYYKNGQKELETNYVDGKKDGVESWWGGNGHKKLETNYKNGQEDGVKTVWHDNGKKAYEGHYKDGKPHGLETGWNEDGSKKGENHYKNGEQIQKSIKTENSECEEHSELAKVIMESRQNGVAMSKLMNMNSHTENSEVRKEANTLTIAAYEKSRFSGDEYKTKSIEDFRDKAYLDCIKAAR